MVSYSIIFLASSLFHLLSLFNFFHFLFHSSFSFSHSLISIGIFVERQMWKCSYCVHTYTIYICIYIIFLYIYIVIFIYVYYIHKMCFSVFPCIVRPICTCMSVCICVTCVCVYLYSFHQIDSNKTYKHVNLARRSSTRHRKSKTFNRVHDNWLSDSQPIATHLYIRFVPVFFFLFFFLLSLFCSLITRNREIFSNLATNAPRNFYIINFYI